VSHLKLLYFLRPSRDPSSNRRLFFPLSSSLSVIYIARVLPLSISSSAGFVIIAHCIVSRFFRIPVLQKAYVTTRTLLTVGHNGSTTHILMIMLNVFCIFHSMYHLHVLFYNSRTRTWLHSSPICCSTLQRLPHQLPQECLHVHQWISSPALVHRCVWETAAGPFLTLRPHKHT